MSFFIRRFSSPNQPPRHHCIPSLPLLAACRGERAFRSPGIAPSVGWTCAFPSACYHLSHFRRADSTSPQITRALRTTLALASYKAKHNVVNVPLSTLEARVAQRNHYPNSTPTSQANPTLYPASFGNDKKRKASSIANANFYSGPVSHGTASYSMGTIGLGGNTVSSGVSTPTPHTSYTFPPPTSNMAAVPTAVIGGGIAGVAGILAVLAL